MLLQKINLKTKRYCKKNIVKKKRVYPRNFYRYLSEEENGKEKENRSCQNFPPMIKKEKLKQYS